MLEAAWNIAAVGGPALSCCLMVAVITLWKQHIRDQEAVQRMSDKYTESTLAVVEAMTKLSAKIGRIRKGR